MKTLTFKLDLVSVKPNKHAKYVGQRSFSANVIVRTHKHTYNTPD